MELMSAGQNKTLDKGGCHCCAFTLGGDAAHPQFHCGYEYFQLPAKDRKVIKLNSFPQVAAEHSCDQWVLKEK